MSNITGILDWLDETEEPLSSPKFQNDPFAMEKATEIHLRTGEYMVAPVDPGRYFSSSPEHTSTGPGDVDGNKSTISVDEADGEHFAQANVDQHTKEVAEQYRDADYHSGFIVERLHHSLNRGHLTIRNKDLSHRHKTLLTHDRSDFGNFQQVDGEINHKDDEAPFSPVSFQLTLEHLSIRNNDHPRSQSLSPPRNRQGNKKPFALSEADREDYAKRNAEIVETEEGSLKRSPCQSSLGRMRQLGIVSVTDTDRAHVNAVAYSKKAENPNVHHQQSSRVEADTMDTADGLPKDFPLQSRWDSVGKLGVVFPNDIFHSPLSMIAGAKMVGHLSPPKQEPWHIETKSYAPKLSKKVAFDLGSKPAQTSVEQATYGNVGTTDQANGPFRFQKPRLARACPDLPSGQLIHGNPFDLTPSDEETSSEHSFDESDDDIVELHEGPERQVTGHQAPLLPIPQTAHVEGTFGRDGDIQVPIFPHAHNTTRCRALSCPIKWKHEKGPYLHEGKLRVRDGNVFGASNPPPEIFDAYDRIRARKEKAEAGSKYYKLVTRFAEHHFALAEEWSVEKNGPGVYL